MECTGPALDIHVDADGCVIDYKGLYADLSDDDTLCVTQLLALNLKRAAG